jgi:hypothetical protein
MTLISAFLPEASRPRSFSAQIAAGSLVCLRTTSSIRMRGPYLRLSGLSAITYVCEVAPTAQATTVSELKCSVTPSSDSKSLPLIAVHMPRSLRPVESKRFAANIPSLDQKDVSNRYAKKGDHELVESEYRLGRSGCAVLKYALASFECDIKFRINGGDHIIICVLSMTSTASLAVSVTAKNS